MATGLSPGSFLAVHFVPKAGPESLCQLKHAGGQKRMVQELHLARVGVNTPGPALAAQPGVCREEGMEGKHNAPCSSAPSAPVQRCMRMGWEDREGEGEPQAGREDTEGTAWQGCSGRRRKARRRAAQRAASADTAGRDGLTQGKDSWCRTRKQVSDGRGGEKIEKEWRMSVPLQPRGAGGWEGRGAGAGGALTALAPAAAAGRPRRCAGRWQA